MFSAVSGPPVAKGGYFMPRKYAASPATYSSNVSMVHALPLVTTIYTPFPRRKKSPSRLNEC